jgi:hypothetical protein
MIERRKLLSTLAFGTLGLFAAAAVGVTPALARSGSDDNSAADDNGGANGGRGRGRGRDDVVSPVPPTSG